jgi:hypothetical protein
MIPLQDKITSDVFLSQRLVQSQAGPAGNQVLQRLRDNPFWLVYGVRKPMFDYERMLCKALLEP